MSRAARGSLPKKPWACPPSERTLADAMDDVGLGWSQYMTVLTLGDFYLGAVKESMAIVGLSLSTSLNLSHYERSGLVSVFFCGVLIGNLLAGPVSDVHGRLTAILIGFAGSLVAASGGLFAETFAIICVCRAVLGVSIGLFGPSIGSLVNEIAPSTKRVQLTVIGSLLWSCGCLYVVGIAWCYDSTLVHLPWQKVMGLAVLPGLILLPMSYFFAIESPRFLAGQGRREEAIAVMERMKRANGTEGDVADWSPPPPDEGLSWDTVNQLRRGTMLRITMAIFMSHFVLSYMYSGTTYAMPMILPTVPGTAPALELGLAHVTEMIGAVMALGVAKVTSRQGAIFYSYCGQAAAFMMFIIGYKMSVISHDPHAGGTHAFKDEQSFAGVYLISTGLCLMRLCDSIAWILMYVYTMEVFPTGYRVTSAGVGSAVGRIGSISAPLVFEYLRAETHSDQAFLFTALGCAVAACVFVAFLPLDTKDRKLEEIYEETRGLNVLPMSKKLLPAVITVG